MSVDSSNFFSSVSKRVRLVYGLAALETALMILLTFIKPVYNRIVHQVWSRYGVTVPSTLHLDVHAIIALLFLVLLIIQFVLGIFQKPGRLSNKFHRMLGKAILFYTPVFIVTALWTAYVRRAHSLISDVILYIIAAGIVAFLMRGILAIRKRNTLKHLDSMIGVFVLSGVVAFARINLFMMNMLLGRPPTGTAWMLVSSLLIYLKLILIYVLAGRLKGNILIVAAQIFPIFLICAIFM